MKRSASRITGTWSVAPRSTEMINLSKQTDEKKGERSDETHNTDVLLKKMAKNEQKHFIVACHFHLIL